MHDNLDDTQKQNEGESQKERKKVIKRILCATVGVAIAVGSFFVGAQVGRNGLDEEMRSLIRLKNTVQKEYYQTVTDKEFYDTLFNAVNEKLLDDYSYYMSAEEYARSQSSGEGKQSGLGLSFSSTAMEFNRVQRVSGNSPAEKAGIVEGDYIDGYGASETALGPWQSFEAFFEFISGYEAGENLYLQVRSGETTRIVEIAKENFVENYVFYRTNAQAYRFSGKNATVLTEGGKPLPCLPDDTAYIRLTQFNGEASEEFKQAMQLFKTQGKKNLVLDLRDNGGGYLHIMQSIASYFCKDSAERTPTVAVADYGEKKEYFHAKGNYYGEYFNETSKIYVLADSSTASASEALIGCMLDYGAIAYENICLSERDGNAKTFGKGIMQTTFSFGLVNADAVKLTTAKILWPVSSRCIHGVGILPQDGAISIAEGASFEEEIATAIGALFYP